MAEPLLLAASTLFGVIVVGSLLVLVNDTIEERLGDAAQRSRVRPAAVPGRGSESRRVSPGTDWTPGRPQCGTGEAGAGRATGRSAGRAAAGMATAPRS